MYEYSRERWRADCEAKGISWAKAALPNRVPDIQEHLREWIDEYERREATALAHKQEKLAQAGIDAARLAAETSRDAAVASKRSAFWTMVAAIVGAVAAVAAAGSTVVSVLQATGRLPK